MLWRKAAIFGLVFLVSGCVTNPPVYDEGILTLDPKGFHEAVLVCLDQIPVVSGCIETAWTKSIIGDFAVHDGTELSIFGKSLDGLFLYSAESRSNIMKWARANCKP